MGEIQTIFNLVVAARVLRVGRKRLLSVRVCAVESMFNSDKIFSIAKERKKKLYLDRKARQNRGLAIDGFIN